MKKGIVKILAVLVLGVATLSGCAIENRNHRGRYDRDRHHDDHGHYDNGHHYDNGRW